MQLKGRLDTEILVTTTATTVSNKRPGKTQDAGAVVHRRPFSPQLILAADVQRPRQKLQDEEPEERREVDGAQQRRHEPAEQVEVRVCDLQQKQACVNRFRALVRGREWFVAKI